MQFKYDITLLIISLLACTVATLVVIEIVERLYIATAQKKKILLLISSLMIGASIWANHVLLSFAFKLDLGEARNAFPSMSFIAWGFACAAAFFNLSTASKRQLKFGSMLFVAAMSSLSTLAMYYFDSASIHGFATVPPPDLFKTGVAFIFTLGMISGLISTLSHLKAYSGNNPLPIKFLVALMISLGIIAVHIAFDQAFAHDEMATNSTIYTQFIGVIAALVFLSLILIGFIFILFFEKYGVQIFKINFLNRRKNTELNTEGLEDSLTKLPNRRAFQRRLDSTAKRSNRTGTSFALAYIDLDHFKPVNDEYGHHIGDLLLSKVAERLNAAVRGCDFVARIGGDEFVAVIEDIESNEDITPIVKRIVSSIKNTFLVEQLTIDISCSVGIAVYPQDGDLEKLMVSADAAMYKAKEGGKSQFKFYDADIETASEQLITLQSELCLAIEKNEFVLAYQPTIDCQTNLPISAEALIRWNHPTKGELLPKAFIQAAERFGLINEISNWVVDECCRTIAQAKQAGFRLNFSINLSSHQFRNPNLVKDILKTLKFYDLDATSLSFEIKETIAINNQNQFKQLLKKFEEAGINVVLDDFGLHPISLAYLQNLHVSEIKLDKSFISGATQDKGSKALIDAVIKLAHALNLQVVAEGVETEAQRDIVVSLGCDYMQGYLFSKPISAENLFTLYKHLHNKQFQIDFETSGQLLVSDYQLEEAA